jgi:hypothetical protein
MVTPYVRESPEPPGQEVVLGNNLRPGYGASRDIDFLRAARKDGH